MSKKNAVRIWAGCSHAVGRECNSRVAPRTPRSSKSCSENGLFTPRAFSSKLRWFSGFWGKELQVVVLPCHSPPPLKEHHVHRKTREERLIAQFSCNERLLPRGLLGTTMATVMSSRASGRNSEPEQNYQYGIESQRCQLQILHQYW